MDHVGIDVHKKESQVCILTQEGEVVEVRVATTRERFQEVLVGRPRSRVLLGLAAVTLCPQLPDFTLLGPWTVATSSSQAPPRSASPCRLQRSGAGARETVAWAQATFRRP